MYDPRLWPPAQLVPGISSLQICLPLAEAWISELASHHSKAEVSISVPFRAGLPQRRADSALQQFSRHFSQGNDLMVGGVARHAGSAISRLEVGLAIGSASARRGSSQIEVGFEAWLRQADTWVRVEELFGRRGDGQQRSASKARA